ncbi:Coiled-coil domain-containing protein [Helicobacter pylori]|uniref:Coiled-coil domain-containing protein n=1 Tax=Helicobacter pylori TaxID=210 RepID=UPI000E26D763|nr:Coiled-coil domain-containing protein [Helicobacter pylori]RDY78761.1 Coiled-coil domain-containing protein [Helicobacter pylori]RDY82253.1 Coiled-coil domain-containing protein [Helicobacter pylori]RDY82363.1 Coiled-coil domain-containing protein [Helicobacter pylori]WQX56594.1 Coiled-coil domain-containing protein [Helicobacter pylori]
MTNAKTESEIFEEQLKGLYQPLKQEAKSEAVANNQNLANQNLANQNLANQNLANQNLANQNLANQSVKDLEAEPSYFSTGIAYLDNKIKDRSITAFDYYMAKKFLGMDLNVNLNGNLNLKTENKTRLASINKATQDIFDDIKALDLGNDLIQKVQEHSGLINQVKLWINHKTRGLKGVDYDLAKTDNARISYANRVAKTMAQGGQVTQKLRDEAKAMTAWGARSKEENTARIAQTQEMLLNSLRKNMQMLESLGGSVSPLILAKIKEYQEKAAYINETSGKIDLKKYQSLAGGGS